MIVPKAIKKIAKTCRPVRGFKYVREWWQRKGCKGTLDQLFDREWNCPTGNGQVYGHIHPIEV